MRTDAAGRPLRMFFWRALFSNDFDMRHGGNGGRAPLFALSLTSHQFFDVTTSRGKRGVAEEEEEEEEG